MSWEPLQLGCRLLITTSNLFFEENQSRQFIFTIFIYTCLCLCEKERDRLICYQLVWERTYSEVYNFVYSYLHVQLYHFKWFYIVCPKLANLLHILIVFTRRRNCHIQSGIWVNFDLFRLHYRHDVEVNTTTIKVIAVL